MKRKKLTKKGSRRLFTVTAMKTHKMNSIDEPQRGGFRL